MLPLLNVTTQITDAYILIYKQIQYTLHPCPPDVRDKPLPGKTHNQPPQIHTSHYARIHRIIAYLSQIQTLEGVSWFHGGRACRAVSCLSCRKAVQVQVWLKGKRHQCSAPISQRSITAQTPCLTLISHLTTNNSTFLPPSPDL